MYYGIIVRCLPHAHQDRDNEGASLISAIATVVMMMVVVVVVIGVLVSPDTRRQ